MLHKGLLDPNATSSSATRYVHVETSKNSNFSIFSHNSGNSSDYASEDFTFVDLGNEVASSLPSSAPNSPPAAQLAHSARGGGGKGEITVVTQGEMYACVFVPHLVPFVNAKYAESIATEYIRSLNFHHLTVSPFLFELLIHFLVTTSKFTQLHQLLQYHVVADSVHVACQLLSIEGKYPPAYQLALDMLKRLNSYDVCWLFLFFSFFCSQILYYIFFRYWVDYAFYA